MSLAAAAAYYHPTSASCLQHPSSILPAKQHLKSTRPASQPASQPANKPKSSNKLQKKRKANIFNNLFAYLIR